jgi:thiamine monophosphate kinase
MDLREIDEFGIINRIRKWTTSSDPALLQGIGDDVAVIKMGAKVLLITTDILLITCFSGSHLKCSNPKREGE